MWPGYKKPEDFITDVGIIAIGGSTEAWGATTDGITWDPGKKVREVEFDGKSSSQVGQIRTIGYDAKLTGKVKRGGASTVLAFEPGSSSDGGSDSNGNTVTLLDARTTWEEGMFLEDVHYIGRQSNAEVMHVYMERAYVSKYKLVTKDNDEGIWDIEIVPVLPEDETNLNKIPFVYRYIPDA